MRASKLFYQNNILYQFVDIVKKPPSKKTLELSLMQSSLDKKKIFNTLVKSFKLIGANIEEFSKKNIIDLLSNDGEIIIKRLILLIKENKFIFGFKKLKI